MEKENKSSILDLGNVSLVASLDADAPPEYVKRFMSIRHGIYNEHAFEKTKVDEGVSRKKFIEEWKSKCKLDGNKKIPYLYRAEGMIGGNNNQLHKQLRTSHDNEYPGTEFLNMDHEKYIVMDFSNGPKEFWTNQEMMDLLQALEKTLSVFMKENCCKCAISICN